MANADPAADYPAALLALDATLVCASLQGERAVSIDQWLTGMMSTALAEAEIVLMRIFALPRDHEILDRRTIHVAMRGFIR